MVSSTTTSTTNRTFPLTAFQIAIIAVMMPIGLVAIPEAVADEALPVLIVHGGHSQEVSIDIADDVEIPAAGSFQLTEVDGAGPGVRVQIAKTAANDGTVDEVSRQLLAVIPPGEGGDDKRRFALQISAHGGPTTESESPFVFSPHTDASLKLSEDEQPVFAYVHGQVTDESVPQNDSRRTRGCFVHPVWGLDGEILTTSFPADHFHHHGIFWAWPEVRVGDATLEHWEQRSLRTKTVRELAREIGPLSALIAFENGWFTDSEELVLTERVWIRAWRASAGRRALDFEITLVPEDQDVILGGRQIKGYGGFTVRFDVWPRKSGTVRVPGKTIFEPNRNGQLAAGDVVNQPLPWADLTDDFSESRQPSGAAVLIHPRHPDYPPTWLTRCYGPLCVGWPGDRATTLKAGVPVTLRYRVLVHRGILDGEELSEADSAYRAAAHAHWETR